MAWTLQQIGEALGVAAPTPVASQALTGFSIDSRTAQPGEVFIALKGPNHDGHDFVGQALEHGAALALVSQERRAGYTERLQDRLLPVRDTFAALQALARHARRAWGRTVIGVSGSTGKTTTKEMLVAVLATRYRVLKSEGNFNNEYGLPLTLLRLEPEHEVTVLEMAMTHKGELAKLCDVAEPNIGLITNVAPVHLEFFSSLEEIASAKRELIEGLVDPTAAVLNADDPLVRGFAEGFRGWLRWFGLEGEADVTAADLHNYGCRGTEFDLVQGSKRARVSLSLPGRAHVLNALAAFAAASILEIDPTAAAEVLTRFQSARMRGEVVPLAGFTVVNDAYNSNPRALRAMAEALSLTPDVGRRILVAGEMRELGPESPDLHRQVGKAIAALGNIDLLVGVSGDARYLVEGARNAGMSTDQARYFETREKVADWLAGAVQPGDWILLKASRAVGLEAVLDTLQVRFAASAAAGAGGGK